MPDASHRGTDVPTSYCSTLAQESQDIEIALLGSREIIVGRNEKRG